MSDRTTVKFHPAVASWLLRQVYERRANAIEGNGDKEAPRPSRDLLIHEAVTLYSALNDQPTMEKLFGKQGEGISKAFFDFLKDNHEPL